LPGDVERQSSLPASQAVDDRRSRPSIRQRRPSWRSHEPFHALSLRTADWGKGDSGGPRQVVYSTRTGFGFSFVLHRPFRPSSSVDLKQNKNHFMLSKHIPKRGYQYQPQHRSGTASSQQNESCVVDDSSLGLLLDRKLTVPWTVSRIDHRRPVSRPQLIIMPDLGFLQTDSPSPPTQHRTAGRSVQRMHFLSPVLYYIHLSFIMI
jgi:hypothetical protein